MKPTRRQVVQMLGALGVAHSQPGTAAAPAQLVVSAQDMKGCLAVQRRDLDESQAEAVRQALRQNLEQFQAVREVDLGDEVWPAVIFRPRPR